MKTAGNCGDTEAPSRVLEELQRSATSLGLAQYQRHIFLCADATETNCASREAGLESWEFLKRRLKELGLSGSQARVLRTKAGCLRVCCQGPIAVVYPEGVWYHSCSPMVIEKIIQEHLIGGCIVTAYTFARRPSAGES